MVHLQHCSNPGIAGSFFDLKCLGSLDFIITNNILSTVLFNCPLNCFADGYTRVDNTTAAINVTRQLVGSSLVYQLSSDLFPAYSSQCSAVIGENFPSATLSSYANPVTKLELYSTSQSIDSILTSTETTYHLPTSQSSVWQPPSCANGKIGRACDISADPCPMANPCLNSGTCTSVHSSFYTCLCAQGFTGLDCQTDTRPCKPFTCLSHGQCIEINHTMFRCDCDAGYEGLHCESLMNYCLDVTCHNNGQCRPARLNFTCECTTNDFTGRYCEIKSSSLAFKQAINRGFGYIAILALLSVATTIIIMDVMKYIFNIDPAQEERKRIAEQRPRPRLLKSKPRLVQRFVYVHAPIRDAILEEP